MKTRPKNLGTAWETWLVNALNNSAIWMKARRIAEGGANDEGDITFLDGFNQRWVVEAKARQTLNITRELAKARKKGGKYTVIAWKRLVPNEGKRRSPDGEAVVVVLSLDTWLELMKRKNL